MDERFVLQAPTASANRATAQTGVDAFAENECVNWVVLLPGSCVLEVDLSSRSRRPPEGDAASPRAPGDHALPAQLV